MSEQSSPPIEIVVRMSIESANTILDGLAKLPIERAGGLYVGLRDAIDRGVAMATTAQQQSEKPGEATPNTNSPQGSVVN